MIRSRTFLILLVATPFISSAEVIVGEKGVLLDHILAANQEQKKAPEKAKPDPAGDDLVLFNNGDLMHGTFGGIDEGLLWERNDIKRPIKFGVPSVKQIVFNSTRRLKLDEKTSFVTLTSGDRIPGEITSLDDSSLFLKSPIIGDLTLPRNLVRSITPNPFSGELHYLGPYSSDGWLTLEPIESKAAEKADPKDEGEEKKTTAKEKSSSWIHSGTSFYSQGTSPLILPDAKLPDTGRLNFNIAWKGRLSIALSLHSDLTRVLPAVVEEDEDENKEAAQEENEAAEDPQEEGEEDPPAPLVRENILDLRKGTGFQSIPWINPNKQSHSELFGTGYTLSLQSGYPTLTRNFFSETGTPRQVRLSTTRSNTSLGESGEANIEIRFNREKSLVMLYINGVYSNQWNDLSGYLGKGSSLGFINRYTSSKIRISEIVVSSWEGSTDSARSMDHPERDVVLLTNGTDRFSGSLSKISDGLAHFKTGYSEIKIPMQELSLINLNQAGRLDLEAEENADRFQVEEDSITVVYQPFGLIKLSPLSSTAKSLTGQSPFLGKVTLDLTPAVLLRFSEDSPDLSSWFDDF